MNYEQKYKEALERARDMLSYKEVRREDMEYIFPELKESEDEKIRKSIIYALRNGGFYDNDKTDEAIAWIEKQGEQKPFNKVEPKFKKGDWVFIEGAKWYKKSLFQIKDVDCFGYSFDEYYTIPFMYEDVLSKWTIEDAKDGDVLASGEVVFIFKVIHGVWLNCHCSAHKDGSFNADSYDLLTDKYFGEVQPATKEQRNLLFQEMKEAGYEWDKDTKVLNKVTIYE